MKICKLNHMITLYRAIKIDVPIVIDYDLSTRLFNAVLHRVHVLDALHGLKYQGITETVEQHG